MMDSIRPHLLVVDDDPSIREGLALALRGTYLVHGAATGHEAYRALDSHPIRAIVLDAVLGDEDGIALIPRLRTRSLAPIILLTGYSTEELAIRAVHARVDGYLKKPVSIPVLDKTLAQFLSPFPQPSGPVERVRRHLEEHPSKKVNLTEFARQSGVSEDHLRRLFRKIHGQPPQRYLAERRIRQAADLLRRTSLGVKEVATAVGWSNVAHFYRLFRRAVGVTPAEYRARRHATPPTHDVGNG